MASKKVLASLARIIQGKGTSFDSGDILTLCPACKRKTFVGRMIGDDLEKINPPGYVPPRRSEKLEPLKTDKKTGATVLKKSCWTCNNGCDALVYVQDGKVIKVEGDASSPTTRGVLCAKGLASKWRLSS